MSLTYFTQLPFELLGELLYYFPIQEITNALDESGSSIFPESFSQSNIILGYGPNCIMPFRISILKTKLGDIINMLNRLEISSESIFGQICLFWESDLMKT